MRHFSVFFARTLQCGTFRYSNTHWRGYDYMVSNFKGPDGVISIETETQLYILVSEEKFLASELITLKALISALIW